MINAFRKYPKCCGWLYTEHHDVINEWNGYYRYDRSDKNMGIGDIIERMSLNDLHSPFYVAVGEKLFSEVEPGKNIEVPLFAYFLLDNKVGDEFKLEITQLGWDEFGKKEQYSTSQKVISYEP